MTATQHLIKVNDGQIRAPSPFVRSSGLQLEKFPSDYTTVQPFALAKKDLYAKAHDISIEEQVDCLQLSSIPDANLEEKPRLEEVHRSISTATINDNSKLAWSDYQSASVERNIPAKTLTSLLPLFREHASSAATIHHAMLLIKKQTECLNPGQSPVMTVDQPLYAIAKEIQWTKTADLLL